MPIILKLLIPDLVLISRLDSNYNLKPVDIEISSQIVNDWFDVRASVKIGEWDNSIQQFQK